MAYISKVKYEEASDEVKALIDEQIRDHGKITNMKLTLLHSVPAYHALMEWFPLEEQIVAITAFATIMIATNIINKSLAVEVDDNLVPYTRK